MAQKFVIHAEQKEVVQMLEEIKGQLLTFNPSTKHTETGIKQWGVLPGSKQFVLYFYPSGRFYLTVGTNTIEVRPEL